MLRRCKFFFTHINISHQNFIGAELTHITFRLNAFFNIHSISNTILFLCATESIHVLKPYVLIKCFYSTLTRLFFLRCVPYPFGKMLHLNCFQVTNDITISLFSIAYPLLVPELFYRTSTDLVKKYIRWQYLYPGGNIIFDISA